ncbi:MAG: hypothetical protein WC421_05205 [Elusimicrobiales bacterium]
MRKIMAMVLIAALPACSAGLSGEYVFRGTLTDRWSGSSGQVKDKLVTALTNKGVDIVSAETGGNSFEIRFSLSQVSLVKDVKTINYSSEPADNDGALKAHDDCRSELSYAGYSVMYDSGVFARSSGKMSREYGFTILAVREG